MRNRAKGDGYKETGFGTRNCRAKRERMRRRTEGDGYKETGFGTRNCRIWNMERGIYYLHGS
jgi:hypothetical protein